MIALFTICMQAQAAANPAPPLDPRELLSTVEASRDAITSGTFEFRYSDAMDGTPRYTSDMTGFFRGHDRYGIALRNHTFFNDGINDGRDPQCVQVFNGAEMLGMWRSLGAQEYFIVDERAARMQCFNPLWLGLAYFPLPGSNPSDLYFWRENANVKYLGPDPEHADWQQVKIQKLAPAEMRSETILTIDCTRGWNVVRIQAELDNGYAVEVESDLALFDDIWFPSRVTMRQQGAGGTAEATVEVLNAELNTALPDSMFDWPQLGAPDGGVAAIVKDLRSKADGLILGYFDGQEVSKERPRHTAPPRKQSPPRAAVSHPQPDKAGVQTETPGHNLVLTGVGVSLFALLALRWRATQHRCT